MFCPKCGTNLNDNAKFCAVCGFSIAQRKTLAAEHARQREQTPPNVPYPGDSNNNSQSYMPPHYAKVPPSSGEKNLKAIIIALVSFIAVLVIAFTCWLIFAKDEKTPEQAQYDKLNELIGSISEEVEGGLNEKEAQSEDKEKPEEKIEPEQKKEPEAHRVNVVDSVNNLIASNGFGNSVAVAVVDNLTNESYMCNGASASYTAWGFYLPVYLAMEDRYPYDYESYKSGIMSSNAGTCNNSANYAIDCFGGPAGITGYIQSNFGCSVTSYGRKFGVVNSPADNYTCASEAALMMNRLNRRGEAYMLCYSPSTFGVYAPSGTTMYAQLGTENVSVRNNLNVFAIIKGADVDYCVAVLTRDGVAGTGFVNTLLENINIQMKG